MYIPEKLVNPTLQTVIPISGGATAYPANGYWVNAKGELIAEPVSVIEIGGSLEDLNEIVVKVQEILKAGDEESFAFSFNGDFQLVELRAEPLNTTTPLA